MRRPLNLAFIVNLYPPYVVGGNEILARDVIEALRARGHTVHVLTGRGSQLPQDGFTHAALDIDLDQKENYFLGGLPLTFGRVWRWHLYNHTSYQGVRRALEGIQPDLVIAWNLYMASMAPLVAARRLPWPVIAQPADKWLLYSLKDLGALVPATSRRQKYVLAAVKGLVQPVLDRLGRPHYILAVSEFIRSLHLRAGFPAAQSRATHLGVPLEQFDYREREHPGSRPWRLIYAGQLWAGKGPQVAIAALGLLRRQGNVPPFTLDIYGGGAPQFMEYLKRLVVEQQLEEQVCIHGFVPRSRLAREFLTHDLFLFCSIWDEPFSGGLLEAMSTGLPAIATTAGGTPEAVRHDQNGLLVPPGEPQALADAITRLMNDPELYGRLGRQAAADVRQQWPFNAYVERLEAVYEAIRGGHRPGKPIRLTGSGGNS